MSTCDSNAKPVSLCTLISVYKSLDENTKNGEAERGQKSTASQA